MTKLIAAGLAGLAALLMTTGVGVAQQDQTRGQPSRAASSGGHNAGETAGGEDTEEFKPPLVQAGALLALALIVFTLGLLRVRTSVRKIERGEVPKPQRPLATLPATAGPARPPAREAPAPLAPRAQRRPPSRPRPAAAKSSDSRPRPALRAALAGAALVAVAATGLLAGRATVESSDTAPVTEARPPAAQIAYVREVRSQIEHLAAARRAQLDRLRAAETPAQQAAAIRRLAAAHTRTVRSLSSAPVPAPLRAEQASMIRSLTGTAAAYDRLAEAAASSQSATYRDGKAAVRRAETRLQRTLREARS
jgi:hypothetical protein